jgi:UDP-N-acetylglucosamine 4-epimerase
MILAARDTGVHRFVYASSSSVYGDHPSLPKTEPVTGRPLSPYAVTKVVNELYASVFAEAYGLNVVGLRYFNVFGSRQSVHGPYAAVIPRWLTAQLLGKACTIYGDGSSSRDFCFVDNAVQANILAATVNSAAALNQVYNIAAGRTTTLNDLHRIMDSLITSERGETCPPPRYLPFRRGDIRHSLADITKASSLLGYAPSHSLEDGLREAIPWYAARQAGALAEV